MGTLPDGEYWSTTTRLPDWGPLSPAVFAAMMSRPHKRAPSFREKIAAKDKRRAHRKAVKRHQRAFGK